MCTQQHPRELKDCLSFIASISLLDLWYIQCNLHAFQRAETERMRALEAEMVEEQKARVESLKLLKSLDAQIEEKQKIEQADFKQFLAEKRLIDEVIAKVREECSPGFFLDALPAPRDPKNVNFSSFHLEF